jgi:hypothetical protein
MIGYLAVVAAFAANQLGWIRPSRLSCALANFGGAGVLTAAFVDRQTRFVLLQGSWIQNSVGASPGPCARHSASGCVDPAPGPGCSALRTPSGAA